MENGVQQRDERLVGEVSVPLPQSAVLVNPHVKLVVEAVSSRKSLLHHSSGVKNVHVEQLVHILWSDETVNEDLRRAMLLDEHRALAQISRGPCNESQLSV